MTDEAKKALRPLIDVIVFGDDAIRMPSAGRFAAFHLRPGVHTLHLNHWEAMCGSIGVDAEAFHAARASGLIGPRATMKPPVKVTRTVLVAADSEEGQAELARLAAASAPEETTVTIDIPDDEIPEDDTPKKKTPAKRKPSKKAERTG